MALIPDGDREVVAAVAALTDCNPFLPRRLELEAEILGSTFLPTGVVWFADAEAGVFDPNLPNLRERIAQLAERLRQRLADGARPAADEIGHYTGVIFYHLWLCNEDRWMALIKDAETTAKPGPIRFYDDFERAVHHYFSPLPQPTPAPEHLFALGFQVRRAFNHIFRKIFGASLTAAKLRATVWESIFSSTPALYRSSFYRRMRDIPTLIIGESGTGKELVARAIALSQYIPFDRGSRSFAADADFCAANLSAFNPSLLESELFGHQRGSFTGALADRLGLFEQCGPHGAVFLDEIGELDALVQVKLLRILQSRDFQRIGGDEVLRFDGKIVAATNRDLQLEIAAGRFRHDLYYRIRGDLITMPTLRVQLAQQPGDLCQLILILARRIAGAEAAAAVTDQVSEWLAQHLSEYTWPGNMRELEQAVRNIIVHHEYIPPNPPAHQPDAADDLAADFRAGSIALDDLTQRYCSLVYAQTGNLEETARRIDVDRRTVRAKLAIPGR